MYNVSLSYLIFCALFFTGMYWRHNDLRANYVSDNTEFHYMKLECTAQ